MIFFFRERHPICNDLIERFLKAVRSGVLDLPESSVDIHEHALPEREKVRDVAAFPCHHIEPGVFDDGRSVLCLVEEFRNHREIGYVRFADL